jgi:two-component sensor histidine kinase
MLPSSQDIAAGWLPRIRRTPSLAWAFGIGCFALAFSLRIAFNGVLPAGLPFITFFLTILLATLVGGTHVGLAVLALSVITSWFVFVPPFYSFHATSSSTIALTMFTAFGGGIVAIAHLLNSTVEQLLVEKARSKRAEERLVELNGELLHRIRNIFTLATTLASETGRHVATPSEMTIALADRFRALAAAQELLATNKLSGADLEQLARSLLSPIAPSNDRLTLVGPALHLSPDATTSICLVLHELATNAVKFRAWSNGDGTVSVEWSVAERDANDASIALHWQERNGPPCQSPERIGLGTLLIEKAVAGASVDRLFLPSGLSCSIEFAQPTAGSIHLTTAA